MGRHSKNKPAQTPTGSTPAAGSSGPGERFDAQFNASRINGASKAPKNADERIAALKKSVSDNRNND